MRSKCLMSKKIDQRCQNPEMTTARRLVDAELALVAVRSRGVKTTHRGTRTRDHPVKSRTLCRLS